jgi:hypothetical protein
MHKKILAICAALVALGALAIPAAASAAVTLREAGATVATGSGILTKGLGEFTCSAGELTVNCFKSEMAGTVVKNNGTTVELTIKTAKFGGTAAGEACTGSSFIGATTVDIPGLVSGTSHWCIKNVPGEDKFELIGANCVTAAGTLTFTLTGFFINCSYTRSTPVTGTFTTTTGSFGATTLTLGANQTFNSEGGFCPATGSITRWGNVLNTTNGTTLQLDDVL